MTGTERAHGGGTAAQGGRRNELRGKAMTDQFAQGGLVQGGGEAWVVIAPDECLLRPPFDGQAVCTRISHPTPTSDCTRVEWIRHISEETE